MYELSRRKNNLPTAKNMTTRRTNLIRRVYYLLNVFVLVLKLCVYLYTCTVYLRIYLQCSWIVSPCAWNKSISGFIIIIIIIITLYLYNQFFISLHLSFPHPHPHPPANVYFTRSIFDRCDATYQFPLMDATFNLFLAVIPISV